MKIKRGDPTCVRGVTYRSIAEAARQIGVSFSTLSAALDRGTQDNCGLRGPVCGYANGVFYASKRDAARALGMSAQTLHHKISVGKIKWTLSPNPVDDKKPT